MHRDWILPSLITVITALVLGLIILASLYSVASTEVESFRAALDSRTDIDACIAKYRDIPKIASDDINFCFAKVQQQSFIDDYRIRRQAFFQHESAEKVTLWLVVIITIAGVGLSLLQLLLSHRLSISGSSSMQGENELIVESGKLSLKSAYVGAIIFGISLLFFFLYMHYVFLVTEVATGSSVQVTSSATPLQDAANGTYLGQDGSLVGSQPTVPPK